MKALQEQVEALTARCFQLTSQLEIRSIELDKIKLENEDLTENCRKLMEKVTSLEEEMKEIKLEKLREAEQREIVENHRKVLQAEITRNLQNYQLDKEKWKLDLDHSKQLIDEKEKYFANSVKIAIKEKENVEIEVGKLKKTVEELKRKETKLKEVIGKNELEYSENRKKMNQTLRELEKDNKTLAEMCKTHKETVARLRRELAQQSKNRPTSAVGRSTSKPKPPRRQSFSATLERPEMSVVSREKEVEEVDEKTVERQLLECNSKYTALLQKSQEAGGDTKALRRELSTLAAEMEAKSQLLYSLKQQRRNT